MIQKNKETNNYIKVIKLPIEGVAVILENGVTKNLHKDSIENVDKKTINYLGVDYVVENDSDLYIEIVSIEDNDRISIDKTSERYFSLFKADKEDILEIPKNIIYERGVDDLYNLKYRSSLSTVISYLNSKEGLEDIALMKILDSNLMLSTKIKVIERVLNLNKEQHLTKFIWVNSKNIANIKKIIGEYIMSQIKKKIEQIRELLEEIESLEEVQEQVENSFDPKPLIEQIVEDNDNEEILAVLKKAGLKFRATAKLKGLEGEELVDWILGLLGDEVSEDDEAIRLLKYELVPDDISVDDDDDDDEDDDDGDDEDDDGDDEDDEDDDESDIDDLDPEELIELAEEMDIEVSKKLKKAVAKGKGLDKFEDELDSIREELKNISDEDDGDDEDGDVSPVDMLEALLEEEYEDISELIEDMGLEDDIEVSKKWKKLKGAKLLKAIEDSVEEDVWEDFVEELEALYEELED